MPDGRLVKVESLTVEVHTSGSASFGGVIQGRRSKFCDEELKKAVGAIVENPGDVNTLGLEVPIVDPRQVYKVCAVIYHEGKKSWSAAVRCDSGTWLSVKSQPGVPDTVRLKVPRRLYKSDARVVLELARVTGDYVSLAELKLFQVEDRSSEDGGVQSAGMTSAFVTRLWSCTPNPFAGATSVNYELARGGSVALSVHDVSGRLVRRLETGFRSAGAYAVKWNGTDGRGRAVPAGVYFLRFSANGVTASRRVTLVR